MACRAIRAPTTSNVALSMRFTRHVDHLATTSRSTSRTYSRTSPVTPSIFAMRLDTVVHHDAIADLISAIPEVLHPGGDALRVVRRIEERMRSGTDHRSQPLGELRARVLLNPR